MTRNEYNELRYIRSNINKWTKAGNPPTHGCLLTIRTNASEDYKLRLHNLYVSLNFHPASVRIDRHMLDDQERIIYIYGREWTDNDGNTHSWAELYTKEERARFDAALHS